MACDAVLFDFDGTLAPNLDLPDMRRQVLDITRTYSVPAQVYEERYIVEVIDAAAAWLRGAADAATADAYYRSAHQRILDIELGAAAVTEPFPDMPLMLDALRRRGVKLGVVTRNCRAAVLRVFPRLLEHVDVLLARDDTPHLKPDSRHLSFCLDTLSCTASRAVMVGDGRLDMHAGRRLDMYCVGVLSGSSNRQALHEAGAHHVLDQLNATNLQQHLGFHPSQ